MITKSELEELGFRRSVRDNRYFYKDCWEIWTLEVDPGNTYTKAAIRKDTDDGRPQEYQYFRSITGIESYLERNEPKNTVHIEELEGVWNTPYPAPPNYNDAIYHAPDERH